jgi:hypothetical protein
LQIWNCFTKYFGNNNWADGFLVCLQCELVFFRKTEKVYCTGISIIDYVLCCCYEHKTALEIKIFWLQQLLPLKIHSTSHKNVCYIKCLVYTVLQTLSESHFSQSTEKQARWS